MVVVGSINVDLVVSAERLPRPGETVTGGGFSRHLGGKGANQAVAAARAGASTRFLCALGVDQPTPDEMVGTMASVPLPLELRPGKIQGVDLYDDPVHDYFASLGMQVMVTPWPQRPDGGPWRRLIRISVAAYNDLEQFERLAAALPGALAAAA